MNKSFFNFWKKQRAPILFFSFIFIIGVFFAYDNSQLPLRIESFAQANLDQLLVIEKEILNLQDTTRSLENVDTSYDIVDNRLKKLLEIVENDGKRIKYTPDSIANQTQDLIVYYNTYLEDVKNNIKLIQSNLKFERDTLIIWQDYTKSEKILGNLDSQNVIDKPALEIAFENGITLAEKIKEQSTKTIDLNKQGKMLDLSKDILNKSQKAKELTTYSLNNNILRIDVLNIYQNEMPKLPTFNKILFTDIISKKGSGAREKVVENISQIINKQEQ